MAVTSCNLENASDDFNKRGKYLPEFVCGVTSKKDRTSMLSSEGRERINSDIITKELHN
jgi:hypothetical protein